MKIRKNLFAVCLMSVLLSACGGGGGGGGGSEAGVSAPEAPSYSTGGGAGAGAPAEGASSGIGATGQAGTQGWDKQSPKRAQQVQISSEGELTQANTEYVLTRDIVANGTAFRIKASNVTLNLNGHTITYGNGGGSAPVYGVAVETYNLKDIAIVNGSIRQGSGAGENNASQLAWHPIHFNAAVAGFEIEGLNISYRTPETSGIHIPWGKGGDIHHNTLKDEGSMVVNRHLSIVVIKVNRAPQMKIHHNQIVRARQGGIDIGNDTVVYDNHIALDSVVTNSVAIGAYAVDGFTIYNNTIDGKGVHPTGIGMVAKAKNGKVYNNRIEVQNTKAGAEYGSTGSAGMRMTWGTDNVEVFNNHITVKAQADLLGGGEDSWGRGLWVGLPDAKAKVTFRDNTIVAKNNDGKAKAAGIAVVCLNQSPGLVFRNNVVVSNWANVLLADDYGHANGYAQFVGNTFRKEGPSGDYQTVRSDYRDYVSTGVFINNRYEGGASRESVNGEFSSKQLKDFAFGWEYGLNVTAGGRAAAGATVKIYDNTGAEVFSGTADDKGHVHAYLVEYWATNNASSPVASALTKNAFGTYGNKIGKNPYTVDVTAGGAKKQEKFEITGNMNATMAL